MKVLRYIHGESSFTVYLEPTQENLNKLDAYIEQECGEDVFEEVGNYEQNIGNFTLIPHTSDWGTVHVCKDWIIVTINKLHPDFEKRKQEILEM